nr:hypothetical protein K-LCC10_0238 [Kaumoebavirus]
MNNTVRNFLIVRLPSEIVNEIETYYIELHKEEHKKLLLSSLSNIKSYIIEEGSCWKMLKLRNGTFAWKYLSCDKCKHFSSIISISNRGFTDIKGTPCFCGECPFFFDGSESTIKIKKITRK